MLETKNQKGTQVYNFSAGPAVLPVSVMDQIQAELKNYNGTGISVMETGHRTKEFDAILNGVKDRFRSLLAIPDTYEILLMQGGARLQFAMIPLNLCFGNKPIDVIHTGVWTKQAIGEFKKVSDCNMVASGEADNFTKLPDLSEAKFDSKASFVYLCSNNTIYGTQWKSYPDTGDVPLVVDMTSDILSRRFDPSKLGIFFASAQKNLGIAGVTVAAVRKDLMDRVSDKVPTMLQYRKQAEANSLINTAPVFAIYVTDLILKWIEAEGGLDVIEKRNQEKTALLYDYLDSTEFYRGCVEPSSRSVMNVVFRIGEGNDELEQKFIKESKDAGLVGLKGHRSVGGLRASIYNAQPKAGVEALLAFMKDFEKKNG